MTSTDEHLAEDVASMNVGAATLPLDAVNVKDGTKLPKPDEGWAWSITDDSASGSQSLLLVKKPPVAQAGSEWHHFDGVECAPSDFYIDLEGSRTDHAPDVRPYLAYIGQRKTTELFPKVKTLAEQEEFFVQEAKRFLLRSWKAGLGMFMKPRVELLYMNTGADHTMPWASLARSHLPQSRRPFDGDVGFEKGDHAPTDASLETIPKMFILTNLRIPLPPKQYLTINPIDHPEQWQRMVLSNYQLTQNPASRFNNGSETSARGLQLGDALDGVLDEFTTPDWREFLMSVVDLDE